MDLSALTPLLAGTPARGETAPAEPGNAATADFQNFLTLLTAQLRHQDPLQPLDSTQFVAQLASFSTVEQLVGVNERLDAQAAQMSAAGGAEYAGWLGHLASATDGRFAASGGAETFRVPVVSGAEQIEAVVRLADGTEIDRIPVVPDQTGQAVWGGGAAPGVPPGTALRIELVYKAAGEVIDRRPAGVFREITGLRGTADGPVFELAGGGVLPPSDVAELRHATSIVNTLAPGLI